MTIKEALTCTVNFPLPANRIEKALIDAELTGTDSYSKEHERSVDLCMSGLLFTLLTSADIAEDDVSVKLPSRDVLLAVYSALMKKWGLKDELAVAQPKIKRIR